jgi:hypothetical protein
MTEPGTSRPGTSRSLVCVICVLSPELSRDRRRRHGKPAGATGARPGPGRRADERVPRRTGVRRRDLRLRHRPRPRPASRGAGRACAAASA